MFAIPLAWLQLKRERIRLLVALAGIGFAVILMFMQLGFRDALFDSAVRFHRSLEGDIFLLNPKSTALIAMADFSERRLFKALGFEGVESGSPIYLGFGLWRNPEQDKRNTRSILVIGFDPGEEVFNPKELSLDGQSLESMQATLEKIKLQDVVLFDNDSREEFGTQFREVLRQGGTASTEISDRRITVGGLFKMGASFGADGNVITSDLNFRRIFSRRLKGSIDVGLIKLKPDADINQVLEQMRGKTKPVGEGLFYPVRQLVARLGGPKPPPPKVCFADATKKELADWPRCLCRLATSSAIEKNESDLATASLPKDVCALSKPEFVAFEQHYWQTSTTIGFIFAFGTVMGFVVGTIIVYQILYTDVTDHLAEYATLKAMGYKNTYLLTVVFQESLILAILGFIPGITISMFLYSKIQTATNLPVVMSPDRAIFVFILTILMCCISGAIAVRKVQSADPAEIF